MAASQMHRRCGDIQEACEIHTPDAAIIARLKDCAKQKDLQRGISLHRSLVLSGVFMQSSFVGNAVIAMYAKCGALDKARDVLDALPIRNGVSWNALISGYASQGHGQLALDGFHRMLDESLLPSSVTYACIFKACSSTGVFKNGQMFYARIFKERLLERHIVVGNALIHMYAKCGALDKAREAFDGLRFRNVVSWTALIAGFVHFKKHKEALCLFEQMQLAGLSSDAVTFACILKACSCLRALERGQEIHAQIVREHINWQKIVIVDALLDMYIKCGALEKAQDLFDKISFPSIVAWTTLIAGYAEHGYGKNALDYFRKMHSCCYCPDAVTFACILKACGSISDLKSGKEVHAQIMRNYSIAPHHIEVGNAIVSMYAKCGAFNEALEVFDKLRVQDAVSFNGLIAGYILHGHDEEALAWFVQMVLKGLSPSKVTFASILKACGNAGALETGQEIHAQIARECLLEKDTVITNALVCMYANCGALGKAQEVFDALSIREIVAWTALITGYVEHEHGEQALAYFERMQSEGIFPDTITFACILKGCGSVGALHKGQKIHVDIVRNGLLDEDALLGVALITMYVNCGMLVEAQQMFDKFPVKDVALWSALMVGYAKQGKDDTVFCLFERMCKKAVVPDLLTFTIVLTTCCRKGLVDEGCAYLEMAKSYGLFPSKEHETCMVDLFGRAGYLEVAAAVIEDIPSSTGIGIWQSLLNACQKTADIEIGEWAFDCAIYQDEVVPTFSA